MNLLRLFKKREVVDSGPIGNYIKQNCVFAHSEQIGDKQLMRMQSRACYLVELTDMDSEGINHGADDTALRNLTWKVLDIVETTRLVDGLGVVITCPKYGSIEIPEKLDSKWDDLNDAFIRKFFPEQSAHPRFLRG